MINFRKSPDLPRRGLDAGGVLEAANDAHRRRHGAYHSGRPCCMLGPRADRNRASLRDLSLQRAGARAIAAAIIPMNITLAAKTHDAWGGDETSQNVPDDECLD